MTVYPKWRRDRWRPAVAPAENAHETQFNLTTHAKRTMEVSQAMYKMTTKEAGDFEIWLPRGYRRW